jgi:FdhE protein
MSTEAITKEYLELHEGIIKLQKEWTESLKEEECIESNQQLNNEAPLIPQLSFSGNLEPYKSHIFQLTNYLKTVQPELTTSIEKLEADWAEDLHKKWFEEAVVVNEFYFVEFAKEHSLPEWLPFFIAENALRPYLRMAAKAFQPQLEKSKAKSCCPACGEPPRLAVVGKKGKKEMVCPRCHYSWNEKKVSCAHCGTDQHEQFIILKPENQEMEQIHACQSCKGYIKVIDIRKTFKKQEPEILDLKSIYLDYIAQEEGFGLSEEKAH